MLTADTAGCDTRLLDQSVGHATQRCLRNTLLFRYGWPTVRTEKFELDLAPVKQGTPRVSVTIAPNASSSVSCCAVVVARTSKPSIVFRCSAKQPSMRRAEPASACGDSYGGLRGAGFPPM